jgi:hypothetical protein
VPDVWWLLLLLLLLLMMQPLPQPAADALDVSNAPVNSSVSN